MTRPEYVHHEHPYRPDVDEFGLCSPEPSNCRCGEKAIPGGVHCADCLIALYAPRWRRFPSTTINQKDGAE